MQSFLHGPCRVARKELLVDRHVDILQVERKGRIPEALVKL